MKNESESGKGVEEVFQKGFFLLAKCNGVHWLTTRDYDLLLQTSEQVVIFRRDGFVASVGYSHNTTHL